MSQSLEQKTAHSTRLQSLMDKHRDVHGMIEAFTKSPRIYYGSDYLKSLKREKLKLKEEITSIKEAS